VTPAAAEPQPEDQPKAGEAAPTEPKDTVHALPTDQAESSGTTEPAPNGTARVPER
jgi:hypothetical protein